MRILIVSDTHGRNEDYLKLVRSLKPLDMVVHCGDIEGSEYTINQAVMCPVLMIAGNNDFFTQLPREREFTIGKYKVWMTHGHTYGVSAGKGMLKMEARARGVDIVMFGHTHRPFLEIEEGLITLNPGSLSYPRQDGRKPSYAIMELDEAGKAHFEIAYL